MDGLGRQIEYFIDEFTILQKRQYIILVHIFPTQKKCIVLYYLASWP